MNCLAIALPSPEILADSSIFYAFRELSMSGIIICVSLFVLSCFSWAVMITKFRMVVKARRQTAQFIEAYHDCGNPMNLYQEGTHLTRTPLYNVYMNGAGELAYQTTGSVEADETFHARLADAGKITPDQMQSVGNGMDRGIGESVLKLESQMSILATAVSGAPFLGLLGTVWGVMDTFTSVASAEGATSLKTLAPGVSSALLTTVTGLVVAIPAMFGYNYLVNAIKTMIAAMENFATELRGDFERCFLDYGVRPAAPVPTVPATASRPSVRASVTAESNGHGNNGNPRKVSASELLSGSGVPAPSHRVVRRNPAPEAVATGEFAFDEPANGDGLDN